MLRRNPPRPPAPASLVAVVIALVAACSPASEPSAPATSAEADERIATVLELRTTLGPAAGSLGSASATVVEQLESLHAALPAEPDERRTAVDALVTGPLTGLEEALAGLGPELAGDATGPDAEAVRAALTDARTSGEALTRAAADDLAVVDRLAGADAQLANLVAAWDEPGSRDEQLQRLAEVAGDAEALASELTALEDAPDCLGRVDRRVEAAETVATSTTELRSLVESRSGEEFDARRAELAQDPFGVGADLVDLDRDEVECWRDEGPVADSARDVADALEALEAALNPPDLATG